MPGGKSSGVELPWPEPILNPNSRPHYMALARAKKRARNAAYWLAKEARLNVPEGEIPLTITFHPPNRRRRDRDNLIASCKAAMDGLADALGVDDHRFVPTYKMGEPRHGGKVVVAL